MRPLNRFLLLFLIVLIASCGPSNPLSTSLPLSGFDKIVLRAPVQVHLKQKSNFSVELVADSFWQSRLDISVVGNTLEVNYDPGAGNPDSMPIYDVDLVIHMPDLRRLEVLSAAKVETDNPFNVDDLDFNVVGAANIRFEGNANDVDVNIAGATVFELDMDMQSLDVDITGAGKLNAEGQALNQSIQIIGAGTVEAFDLKADDCDVSFLGAGKVEVHAQNKLNVNIVGAGIIYYKGNPTISKNIAGFGELIDSN